MDLEQSSLRRDEELFEIATKGRISDVFVDKRGFGSIEGDKFLNRVLHDFINTAVDEEVHAWRRDGFGLFGRAADWR